MRAWLAKTPWELLILANQSLCEKAGAFHKISSLGGKKSERLWEEFHKNQMTLEEMIRFCKRIHFAEPFVNLNGNTLAAVALEAIDTHIPKTCSKSELDEAICAVIAGTVQRREEITLKTESDQIDSPQKPEPDMK